MCADTSELPHDRATPGATLRGVARRLRALAGESRARLHLARWRRKLWRRPAGSLVRIGDFSVRISDGPNAYMLYKDLFIHRLYHFEAQRPDPLILDGGSNIGLSILYFKQAYPRARIIGFEPDPALLGCLNENLTRNGITDVRIVPKALARNEGALTFFADGKYASFLARSPDAVAPAGWTRCEVECVRLAEYLSEPVDFLKLNVEGAEYDVLAGCAERLRSVRELILEYHHLPGLPRTLHQILALLHEQGFAYLVNDLDPESNGGVCPPFHLDPETRYFLVLYARRMD